MQLTVIHQVQHQVQVPNNQPSQHPVHPVATGDSKFSKFKKAHPSHTSRLSNLPLPTHFFLQMMKGYLNGPEFATLTSTCKPFMTITRSRHLWKTLCQQQNPISYPRFEILIQQQTPDVDKQGLAWQRLYGFQYQGRELPWKQIFKVGKPSSTCLYGCNHIAILPNGNIVTSSTVPGHAGAIWSSTGQQISNLMPDAESINKITVLPNGNFITCNADLIVRIWDHSGKVLANLNGHTAEPTDIALLPNGNIVTVAKDGLICMWSFAGQHIKTIVGHTRGISSVAVLPGGGFVTGSFDCTAVIWSDDGQKIVTLTGHTERIEWVAALPNGCIVTRAGDQDARGALWSSDGQLLKYFPPEKIDKIAIMPNGGFVTTGNLDVHIRSKEGECLSTLDGHESHISSVTSVAVFPDGRIVTGSCDHTVRIWSPTGKHLTTLKLNWSNEISNWNSIRCIKLLPNGDILTGEWDGTLRLWSENTDVLVQASPSRAACAIS